MIGWKVLGGVSVCQANFLSCLELSMNWKYMKSATLTEIKKELTLLPSNKLIELCLRISKYKKENKELLSYLLFEAQDEEAYKNAVKEIVDEMFVGIPSYNTYHTMKALRKILRLVNRYTKYSGVKQSEAELLIYYLMKLKASGIRVHSSASLAKMVDTQRAKIQKAIATLHEDLQYDYQQEVDKIIL